VGSEWETWRVGELRSGDLEKVISEGLTITNKEKKKIVFSDKS